MFPVLTSLRIWWFFELLIIGSIFTFSFSPSSAQSAPEWKQQSPAASPPARKLHAMAFDENRHRIVLFGGYDGSNKLDDTWEFDGFNWTEISCASSPSARYRPGMIYAGNSQKVILFGGYDGAQKNDFWEYDGTNWIENTTVTNSPSIRSRHTMAYDSSRNTILLFGGLDGTWNRVNDTWEYNFSSNSWTELTPAASPPGRSDHTIVYDSHRDKIVLFGGNTGSARVKDTWEYDRNSNTWTEISTTHAPSGRSDFAMVYDPDRQKVVLFGGYFYSGSSFYYQDTWEYDGSDWSEIVQTSPPDLRGEHAMAYDSSRQTVVLFGGFKSSVYHDDTWEYVVPPNEVWVNDDWASGVNPGDDPDGGGPATAYGTDAFSTIQSAIAGVADGGTVTIHAGIYNEQVRFTKTIFLTSSTGDFTTGGVTINPDGTEFDGPEAGVDQVRSAVTFESGSQDSLLKGITIENDHSSELSGNSGIEVIKGGIGNVRIANVRMKDVSGHGFGIYESTYTWPALSGWIIENCSVSTSGVNNSGIIAQNMDNVTIRNCEVGQAHDYGIQCKNVNGAVIQNCTIHTIQETGLEIDSYCTSSIEVSYNEFRNTNLSQSPACGDLVLTGQFLPDPHGDSAAVITIQENMFRDGFNGIHVKAGEDITTRTITINSNQFSEYENYGVQNAGSGVLNAEQNWWGHESGPYHAVQNPDGQGVTVSDNVNFGSWLTNVPGNNAPTTEDDQAELDEDTQAYVIDVLQNDHDPDPDTLSITLVSQGQHGSVAIVNNNLNTAYTPNSNYFGPDQFTYTASDGRGGSDTASVSITVNPVPDAPVVQSQSLVTDEEYPIHITLKGSDADGDKISFSIVSEPIHGLLKNFNSSNGTMNYQPDSNFSGKDSFQVKANDGQLESVAATIQITVHSSNDPPVAYSQTVTTQENTPISITLSGSDADGDSFSFLLASNPSHGSSRYFNATDGTLMYVPETGYYGMDSFQFYTNDGSRQSNQPAVVTILITPLVTPTPTPTKTPRPPTSRPSDTATPTSEPTLTPTVTWTWTPTATHSPSPTTTWTPTMTLSPTYTRTPSPLPTNTPRAGNRLPTISIHSRQSLLFLKDERAMVSVIVSDKDRNPLHVTYSDESRIQELSYCCLAGNILTDVLLNTSHVGTFEFSIFAYDFSDTSEAKVQYHVVNDYADATRTPAPTLAGSTPTPALDFYTGSIIVSDSLDSMEDLSDSSDFDRLGEEELVVRWCFNQPFSGAYCPFEILVYSCENESGYAYAGRMEKGSAPYFLMQDLKSSCRYTFQVYILLLEETPRLVGPFSNAGPVLFQIGGELPEGMRTNETLSFPIRKSPIPTSTAIN